MTLEDLYDEYESRLYRLALNLTADPTRADDLVQDTYMRAMGHLKLLEMLKPYQRRAWLYQTLKNLFIDEQRALKRRRAIVDQLQATAKLVEFSAADFSDPQIFEQIPAEYKQLFKMRYVLDMSSKEIADVLGVPPGTVRSRLHHGMKKLRSQISNIK